MSRRALLALAFGLATCFSVPASAQEPGSSPSAPAPSAVAVRVALETSAGTILVETDPRAPITAANFLRYVDEHRFDGTDFYRGMALGAGTGIIQGGTSNAPDPAALGIQPHPAPHRP